MSSNNNMRITDLVTVLLLLVLIVLNIFNSVHVGKVKIQMASLLGPGGTEKWGPLGPNGKHKPDNTPPTGHIGNNKN